MFVKYHSLNLFSDADLTRNTQKATNKKNEANEIRKKEERVKR